MVHWHNNSYYIHKISEVKLQISEVQIQIPEVQIQIPEVSQLLCFNLIYKFSATLTIGIFLISVNTGN